MIIVYYGDLGITKSIINNKTVFYYRNLLFNGIIRSPIQFEMFYIKNGLPEFNNKFNNKYLSLIEFQKYIKLKIFQ